MSNSAKKQAIHVGILEISSQNKAILEYFFSDAGKSYFKEVSLEKASAYIIDYDSVGAKESWNTIFNETKKPGIIISIKEVDLPSTIWLQKPLTVKALQNAGDSIREVLLNEEAKEVTVAAIEEIKEVEAKVKTKVKEKKEVVENANKEIFQEVIEERNQQAEDIDIIGTIDLPEISDKDENAVEVIEETTQVTTIPEETLQLDNLLIDEFLETPKKESIDASPEEFTLDVEANETINATEQKEPELALVETDTSVSVSVSASSTDYATSENFVDIDLSLDVNTTDNGTDNTKISTEQEFTPPLTTDNTEDLLTSNDDMDSLLESLISGGEDNKKTDKVITDITENETNLDLPDFDSGTNEENEENIIDTRAEYLVAETKAVNPKQPEKSAEEELQSLLEEIRQEADGETPNAISRGNTSKKSKTYSPTVAEERWKLICGTHNNSMDIQKLASFEPNNHILSTIVQNVETAKQNKETIRVKFNGIIVVIDPETDSIYCNRSIFNEFYANICFEPIKKGNIKIHNLDASELRLYRKKMQEEDEYTHSIEAFIWTTSLLTSRGRLPKMTNVQSKVGLNSWPNLTRVENIPHMMQIAALFHKNTWSLLEIINKSGISKKYIIAFYNAVLALNMIETNGASISSASLDFKKSDNENRSLFSRFLKKITA